MFKSHMQSLSHFVLYSCHIPSNNLIPISNNDFRVSKEGVKLTVRVVAHYSDEVNSFFYEYFKTFKVLQEMKRLL